MNKDMRLLLVAMLVVAVISVAAFTLLSNYSNNNSDEGGDVPPKDVPVWPITALDLAGHKVSINDTIKHVAVTDLSTLEVFATAYGEGWEDMICAMPEDYSSKDPSLGSHISKTWPKLSSLPTIPDLETAFASNPNSVAKAIADAKPDLVILPKAVTDRFPDSLDGFYSVLDQAGVPYFHMMFYALGLSDSVSGDNIGQLCKLLQKDVRGDEVCLVYDLAVALIKDRLKNRTDTIRFYVEAPAADPSVYGTVSSYGYPEVDIIGYNIQKDYGGGENTSFDLAKMVECKADWILLVGTPYYDGKQLLGYYVDEGKESLSACMAQYLAREGWSDLDAVKNKHVCLCYGELRYGICGIYDLFKLANTVDKTLVSDDDLQTIIMQLNKHLPWSFDGTFTYVME